jgi:hypothetical protein
VRHTTVVGIDGIGQELSSVETAVYPMTETNKRIAKESDPI